MKNRHIPEIRFSGYSGDWEELKIGEFLKESRISGTNGLEAKKLTVKLWGKGVIPKDEIYQGSEATKYYIRKAGQFIYGKLDFLHQAFGIIPDKLDGYESTLDSPAFDIADNLNSYFFLEYVSRKQFYLYQGTIANGSRKAKRIHSETFLEMPLIVPTVEEQSDIGNFFKNLDDTIALHQQELITLKQTKQGFLQKMFPKEGESVPEVRFPGFTGEWEQRKFKDFISKAGKKNTKGENYPAYSVSNKLGLVSQTEQFDGSRLDELDKTSYKLVNPNEFAYNPARINVGSIAFNNLNKTVIVSSLYVVLKMSEELNNDFILQYIKSQFFIDEVRRNTEGSVRDYLFYENFKNIKFPYTSSKDEQIKIGTFFKQLDDTIALHQRELDALKETKKAFLQKMFV
ncbi:restriction endonuclease [Brevibacillus halotolerans]|uniref:restriction endonuclease subunit S n=1 Tax=Brevibacillus halotolerans TaxID=1507437 RepID=UPI001B184A87|nr:restriction endonuclease subunit S [Brevibacillus halotolerans]GIO02872.1 restriction endonuclease [Brevibacillus halotolerans]